MTVYILQTFVFKQDKFKDGLENLNEIKKFRNEEYGQKLEILTPVSGEDQKYAILTKFEGLAEMELQNKKLFEDEEYLKLMEDFFLKNITEGSMYTQIYRGLPETKVEKK
ncbi:hypothetical protein [Bacillus salipaludis]|uniref:ABM domain-containing protein n=1 Tax=Bacillus salipaludis TaxID=2547811 RepID=A0ABW8RM26_9BACI